MLIKKVKYTPRIHSFGNLTINRVYDVVEYKLGSLHNSILLVNDKGELEIFYATSKSNIFTDVTAEYRNNVIDDILN